MRGTQFAQLSAFVAVAEQLQESRDPPRDHGATERRCLMNQTSEKGSIITLINVFTVDPANQPRLVELLTRATDGLVNRAPGFISSTLHRSVDGTKVIMYAQWLSAEDYQAMRQDPEPLPFLQEALTIAKFEPGKYEIVRKFWPAGENSQSSGRAS
jgi:heme-degrading monooxygenase HmoA